MTPQGKSRQVVNLLDYKKQKQTRETTQRKDPSKILDEVSYYILMAAKAMTDQKTAK